MACFWYFRFWGKRLGAGRLFMGETAGPPASRFGHTGCADRVTCLNRTGGLIAGACGWSGRAVSPGELKFPLVSSRTPTVVYFTFTGANGGQLRCSRHARPVDLIRAVLL